MALLLFLLWANVSCYSPAPRTLVVFGASSLTDAFRELGAQFERAHPGVAAQFSFAGSQQLALQLNQGARADVFASADERTMDSLRGLGADAPRIFARNRLIVIVPAKNPANVRALRDLAKPGLKLDLAAEGVPVGAYTLQMLDKASAAFGAAFKANVLKNVVSQETNVRQVVTKVGLGEVDAGIVYATDAAAKNVLPVTIPDEFNILASYSIVALKNSSPSQLAQDFVALALSAEGQAILKKYGFLEP